MNGGGRLVRVVLILGVFAAVADTARAEPVAVRAGVHQGHGRLVFNWTDPVPYAAEPAAGVLRLRFGRPIEADFGPARRVLSRYLAGASVEADGRTAVLALNGNPQVAHYYSGSAVVVDIFDQQAAAPAAPAAVDRASAPAATPSGPAGAPTVSVRSGDHDGYSRLVFDWPRPVSYDVARDGDRLTLAFAAPARLDIDAVRRFPPRNVRALTGAAAAEERPTVTVTVPQGARVRDFVSGAKVVLDIYGAGAGPSPPATPPSPPATPPALPSAAAQPPAQAETPAPAAQPAPASPTAAGPAAATPPATPPAAPNPPAVAARPVAAASTIPAGQVVASAGGVQLVLAPTDGGQAPPPAKAPASRPAGGPVALTPPGEAPASANAGADAADEARAGEPPLAPGEVVVRLRFDWDEPVASAVFRRGGSLWVLFDKAKPLDIPSLLAQGGNLIRNAELVPTDQATAVRMETVTGANPRMRRDGLAWILEFRQQATQVSTPIETQAQPNTPAGARVFMPITEPGRAVALADPNIGDNLVVVPVVPLGHGIPEPRRFPEFDILPTLQGIVIRPRIDDLRVRSLRQGVELTAAGGLALSPVTPRLQADLKLGALRPLTRVFELERWHDVPLSDARIERQRLMSEIARLDGAEKEKKRFELAQFFLSLGFESETLGVLRAIEQDRPEVTAEPAFRALRGTASMLMGRAEDAAEDLNHVSLDSNDEGNFLRAALQAERGDLVGAAPTLKRTNGILRPYPMAVKLPLGLAVVESAIEVGDVRLAGQVLDVLLNDNPDDIQQAQIGYLLGRIHELGGDFDGAIVTWEKVMDSDHRPSRARAAMARVEMLMKTAEITREAGIKALEELRFAWRGDGFEFNLLRRLGDLYLADGNYREALRTMRQAATYFRERPEAAEVTHKMAQTFESLFRGDLSDKLAPLTAIALYEEFKELTPTGEKGDEMIRTLAERLVAVDLLAQAAALLDNQVAFRLQGEQKAAVATRLAEIRMLNREPEAAVKAIEQTAMPNLAAPLATKRRYLAARAMLATGRGEAMMALLDKDESPEADLLRLEHYWNGQDWANAASVMRRVVDASGIERGQPMDAEQARLVLNLSVALTLSGNQRAVNRLRRDYGPAMEASPYKDAFELIASSQAQGLADYRTIAGKVAVAENFQSFMASYRERLKAQEASSIN